MDLGFKNSAQKHSSKHRYCSGVPKAAVSQRFSFHPWVFRGLQGEREGEETGGTEHERGLGTRGRSRW